jgi:hypothetical protein
MLTAVRMVLERAWMAHTASLGHMRNRSIWILANFLGQKLGARAEVA